MAASEATNQLTRAEWRQLGFFYEREDTAREWRLIGSRSGLQQFADLLRAYATNPKHGAKSEHAHYGPYMYLKIMTWPQAGLDEDAIFGPVEALAELAAVVERRVLAAEPGAILHLRREFAPDSEYELSLQIREDGFDPAAADPSVVVGAG